MRDVPSILAEVTFLPTSEGGRRALPELLPWGGSGWYMPHVVVDGGIEYLGVRFTDGPTPLFGVPGDFRLALMYHPDVDYSALVPGVTFTVREGAKVVATGRVLKYDASPPLTGPQELRHVTVQRASYWYSSRAVGAAKAARELYGLESQEGAPRTGLNNSSFS